MSNAILIRDFRIYSRNKEYFNVFIIYVFILCAVVFGMLWFADTNKKPLNPEYGSNIFSILIISMSLAIYSICPVFAVNITSSEKNNIDLIKSTLLRSHQIILSKTFVIIANIFILIFLSFPIMISIMPICGFTLKGLLNCYLIIFIYALTFGMIGVMWSSIFSRMTAISVTYISVGILSLGTILTPLIMSKILKIKLSLTIINVLNALSPFWILSKKISETNLSDKIFTIPLWLFPILVYFLILLITIALTFIFVRRW